MAEPTQNGQEGQINGQDGHEQEKPERSQLRIKDLLEKTTELGKQISAKDEELQKEREEKANLKFEVDFTKALSKFPLATQHQNDIRSLVKEKNLPVDDAVTLILAKNQKLVTSDQLTREQIESMASGGSADNSAIQAEKTVDKASADDLLSELQRREKEGDFNLFRQTNL